MEPEPVLPREKTVLVAESLTSSKVDEPRDTDAPVLLTVPGGALDKPTKVKVIESAESPLAVGLSRARSTMQVVANGRPFTDGCPFQSLGTHAFKTIYTWGQEISCMPTTSPYTQKIRHLASEIENDEQFLSSH